jgi:hypothetical protein
MKDKLDLSHVSFFLYVYCVIFSQLFFYCVPANIYICMYIFICITLGGDVLFCVGNKKLKQVWKCHWCVFVSYFSSSVLNFSTDFWSESTRNYYWFSRLLLFFLLNIYVDYKRSQAHVNYWFSRFVLTVFMWMSVFLLCMCVYLLQGKRKTYTYIKNQLYVLCFLTKKKNIFSFYFSMKNKKNGWRKSKIMWWIDISMFNML